MEESPRDVEKTQSRDLGEFPEEQLLTELGSLCFMPFVLIQRRQKTRTYCQKPIRGAFHLYPYSSFVRQGKTKGLTVLLFPLVLENLIHPLALSCGADPIEYC